MKIKSNKKAPNFKLMSTSSKTFELSKLKNGVIIYFYPIDSKKHKELLKKLNNKEV